MPNPWFKFYGGEYLTDLKIFSLTASERSCWVTILCLASQTENGVINFLTEEKLMVLAGIQVGSTEWQTTAGVLQKFENLKMVTLCNAGVTVDVKVLNWPKRQASESYERVKRFREKHKSNADVTQIRKEEIRIDESGEESESSIELAPKPSHFFESPEEQLAKLAYLVEKGIPEDTARRELQKFVAYWTEPNSKGKPRYKGEKYFDVDRRLVTWFSKVQERNKSTTSKKVINLDLYE